MCKQHGNDSGRELLNLDNGYGEEGHHTSLTSLKTFIIKSLNSYKSNIFVLYPTLIYNPIQESMTHMVSSIRFFIFAP